MSEPLADLEQWTAIADTFLRRDYDDVVALMAPLPDEAKLAFQSARSCVERREIAAMVERMQRPGA